MGLLLAMLLLMGPEARADDSSDDELVVRGSPTMRSASDRTLDRAGVEAMPARSADDLLGAMPGLHQSAHGGQGKAYQYFLRGFDAVHGADLAVDVGGVPVNEVSNVHAHGYLDLHFIPPVLVRQVDLHPGSATMDSGDFAVAGSASFDLGLDRAGGVARLGGGTDQSGMATLAWRPAESRPGTFLVADADVGQGVGMARSWRQLRGAAGLEGLLGGARARTWVIAYDGRFESPGVLREDDLLAGEVDFYDAYPGSGGGRSTRVLGSAQITGGGEAGAWQATTWGGWRTLTLDQNFTGWYDHTESGDGTRQDFTAHTAGASGRSAFTLLPGVRWVSSAILRVDHVSGADRAILVDGTPASSPERFTATHTRVGAGTALTYRPRAGLELEPGVRAETFLVATDAMGLSWAPVLAPKLRARVQATDPWVVLFSYGRAFRSPDARGVTGGRTPIAQADTMELGTTLDPVPWIGLRAAGFATLVSDEIVFDHVAARYVATGETRRLGIDGGVAARPIDNLRVAIDATWSDGRYISTDIPIPFAPRLLVVGGVYAERLPIGETELTGGIRTWFLGPRPIPDGFTTTPALVVDLTSTLRWQKWGVSLDVDNVLGSNWRDGEFVYASDWRQDDQTSQLPARHFTAGAPRAARLAVSRRF